ncbi:hypothetical protein Zmor_011962 [Zophobas morio]|jgi:hypothetical protein|uniref:Uncharacterized protein n=1 Tax=Zophobas morio TaxID=2755281 RepID=A0AA38HLE6_9CUCU|nr:hypothetical protein Zmor_011962 [Zophobas morio]
MTNFEISGTTENIFQIKFFNPVKIDKENITVFMKEIEDLILQATVPEYKLNTVLILKLHMIPYQITIALYESSLTVIEIETNTSLKMKEVS